MSDFADGFKGTCEICGEPYDCMSPLDSDLAAEMYHPTALMHLEMGLTETLESQMVHGQCGIDAGMEMA